MSKILGSVLSMCHNITISLFSWWSIHLLVLDMNLSLVCVSQLSCVWLFVAPQTVALLSVDLPCKNAGVGCCFLFDGIFPTQGIEPSCIREGNGSPLQCSCLENPRDGGAWWTAICGVAQSRTRLKRLSSSSSSPACQVNSLPLSYLWGRLHACEVASVRSSSLWPHEP